MPPRAPDPVTAPESAPGPAAWPAWPEAAAGGIAALTLARLAAQAARGTFCSDECFHAAAMHVLRATHALPDDLPQFYSGFRYFYHPAFHVLGALWLALFGERGLHLLPVAITAATTALFFSGRVTGTRRSGAWAALALLSVASFADYATRLYADGLIVLLFVAIAGAWCAFAASPTRSRALLLGGLVGLALLGKFTSLLWLGLLFAAMLVALARRHRTRARGLALAIAVAVAIVLPWWWRNQMLFGSAFYPAGAPDVDRALQALNTHRYSDPPLALLLACVREAAVAFLLAAPVVVALVARGRDRYAAARLPGRATLLGATLVALPVAVCGPYAALRHLDALVAVLLVAAAPMLEAELRGRGARRLAGGITAALLLSSALLLWRMGDHRADQEPPAELAPAFRAVRDLTPPDARILSLWTYDTAYQTHRQATWPIPWGQEGHPVRLFRATDARALLAAMDGERIGWLLVPTEADSGAFDSANHPADFMARVDSLVASGALREAWSSDDLRLIGRAPGH